MTLQNLLAIQRLQAFEANAAGVLRLLAAAERNLADAAIKQLSIDNRFDAAYKYMMQCASWAYGQTATEPLPANRGTIRPRCKPRPKPLALDPIW